jgi:hypothetical protein
LKSTDKIDSGAYADVFHSPHENAIYKVFLNGRHPTNFSQGFNLPEDDERRRLTFSSEVEAYRRASADDFLSSHIPRFLGTAEIADIEAETGSVAHLYLLDCCYSLELLAGKAVKLGSLNYDCLSEHLIKALDTFRSLGIKHVSDASVFSPHDRDLFKFIDFGIEEFEPMR